MDLLKYKNAQTNGEWFQILLNGILENDAVSVNIKQIGPGEC